MISPLSARRIVKRWHAALLPLCVFVSMFVVGSTSTVQCSPFVESSRWGAGHLFQLFFVNPTPEQGCKSLPIFIVLFTSGLTAFLTTLIAHWREKRMKQQIDAERIAVLELTSHQLGAPIATFKWWMEILSDPKQRKSAISKDSLETIQESVTRMDAILTSLQEAETIANEAVRYKVQTLASLRHFLQRIVDSQKSEFEKRGQKIEITLQEDLRAVKLDTSLVESVLDELIRNAIHYSPNGATIRVHVKKHRGFAHIEVVDEGHGIPAVDQKKIFEKFYRASNAAKYKPVGNGLGLYIAKGIIERAGGSMSIKSVEEKGTTVSFTLPMETVNEEEEWHKRSPY